MRERKKDIPELVNYFLVQSCDEHNRRAPRISPDALRILTDHDWSGNVRELKSLVNRLVIFLEKETIDDLDVLALLDEEPQAPIGLGFREAMNHYEKKIIVSALIANNWNVTDTAGLLQLDRSNLHKKMQKLGILRNISDS